jgi:hypothetical protein
MNKYICVTVAQQSEAMLYLYSAKLKVASLNEFMHIETHAYPYIKRRRSIRAAVFCIIVVIHLVFLLSVY